MTALLDRSAGPVAPATGPGDPGPPDDVRRNGARVLAIGAAWVVAILYVAHAALPPNALRLPGERPLTAAMVLPQSWAFFTKSPRGPVIGVVERGPDGVWRDAWGGSGAEPHRLFGAARETRHQGVEAELLTATVDPARWTSCTTSAAACAATAPVAATVDNTSPDPVFCGSVAVVQQEPTPWAWARSGERTTMPSAVLRLEVRC